jgi:hypothetical protein
VGQAGIASVVERLGVPVPRLLHVVTVVGCFANESWV